MGYGDEMRRASIFSLSLLACPVAAQQVQESPEPNATTFTATAVTCGDEAVGFLSSVGDEDWFSFSVPANTLVRLATAPGPAGDCRDTVVTLLDSTGGPLRQSDDAVGAGYYSELAAVGLSPGVYFAAVSAGAQAVAGSYALDISCASVATPSSPPLSLEGPENNDPLTGGVGANAVAPFRASGSLQATGADGDWDFWRMLVFGDQVVRIQLGASATIASGAAEDPVVYLYDAASPPNVVAGPFYAGDRSTWDQDITVRLSGGVHQLAVRGADGSQPGAYFVDVTIAPAAPGVALPGGCNGRALSLATATLGPGAPRVLEGPRLGTTYSVNGSGLGALGYCFYAIGTQAQALSLTPLGAPGCSLDVVPIDVRFAFADSVGSATWSIQIPPNPAFTGTQLHSQVAVLDLSNALGLTTSNRVLGVVAN